MTQLTEDAINKIQLATGQAIRLLKSGWQGQVEAEADIVGQLTKVPIKAYWVGDILRVDIRL